MERLVKKYEQKYKKAREEMDKWNVLQSRLLNQLQNAIAIIERLKVLEDSENYGVLNIFTQITKELPGKQMESLETIFASMQSTLAEFDRIVKSLEKIWRDSCYLLKGETVEPTVQQMHMRVGIRPSLSDCLDGIKAIYDMHLSEYLLKVSIISALTYSLRANDLAALQAILIDQPNIPTDEVVHPLFKVKVTDFAEIKQASPYSLDIIYPCRGLFPVIGGFLLTDDPNPIE